MLVIKREPGESIKVGPDVTIHILKQDADGRVRVGVEAPDTTRILRTELVDESGAFNPHRKA